MDEETEAQRGQLIAQGHTAYKWQSLGLKPVSWALGFVILNTMLCSLSYEIFNTHEKNPIINLIKIALKSHTNQGEINITLIVNFHMYKLEIVFSY